MRGCENRPIGEARYGSLIGNDADGFALWNKLHVVISLIGRFKHETGERNLSTVLANGIKGGLQVRKCWMDRWTTGLLLAEGKHNETGLAVYSEDGFMMESLRLNGEFHGTSNDMIYSMKSHIRIK